MTYKISPWTTGPDAEVIKAAENLFDNRLGWSEGRNPYAPPELWEALGAALGRDNVTVTAPPFDIHVSNARIADGVIFDGPNTLENRLMMQSGKLPSRLELENHMIGLGSQFLVDPAVYADEPSPDSEPVKVEFILGKITDVIRKTPIADIKAGPVTREEFDALVLEVGYLTRLLDGRRSHR